MIKVNRNPDVYHGNKNMTNFFEGWYFKIVQANTGRTYSFIPGVFYSYRQDQSHSFIQVLKGDEKSLLYLRLSKDAFRASNSEFKLKVGESIFSLNKIHLNINQQNEQISGTLNFYNISKWPDSTINPGSMGFYNYLGFMQCYSQVCAINGMINGKLSINGETIDFTGGNLYIEKNWGTAFPYSYIWVQGNSFKKGDGSVSCSIGHIPFPIKSFTGFLIGVYAKGRFYKFTSINKSSLIIYCDNELLILKTYNKDYFLKIEASYNQENFMNLFAPSNGKMLPIASETIHGNLHVTLYNRKNNYIIFHDNCSSAGIEFSENYKKLINRIHS